VRACLLALALSPACLTCARRSGEGGPPIQDTVVGTPGTTTFTLNWLTDVDPLAVCNDGSPAAYYFAPGSGSSGACARSRLAQRARSCADMAV
jgi:hypothetical protein